jgi:hypothetical protein
MTPTGRNGTQATSDTYPNQQQYSTWHHHQQHPTTLHQSNGHVVPLALQPPNTRPIQLLLVPWTNQSCRLLDKASLHSTSHWKTSRNLNTVIHSRSTTCFHKTSTSQIRKRLAPNITNMDHHCKGMIITSPSQTLEVMKG